MSKGSTSYIQLSAESRQLSDRIKGGLSQSVVWDMLLGTGASSIFLNDQDMVKKSEMLSESSEAD